MRWQSVLDIKHQLIWGDLGDLGDLGHWSRSRILIPAEERFVSEQCLNPADNLKTVEFRNRALYSAAFRHGNQRRRDLGRTEEDGEMRHELIDCAGGLQSVHYRHAKIQDEDVWRCLLNFCDCITTVECFRTDPPGVFFNQLAQSRS